MRKGYFISALMALILAFSVGCAKNSDVKQEEDKKVNLITEEELGYRTTTLYDEKLAQTPGNVYHTEIAGTSKRIERAFDNAPPMIPHSTEGLLPITKDNNMCTGCHMPEMAKAMGAVPIPKSHFVNLRTNQELDTLYQGRFNCSQCHTPQAKTDPIVENKFEGAFRTKEGRFSSNLMDNINEGVSAD